MERETKKRKKMESIEEDGVVREEEDGDGEKMEKFFALLRRRKEMQDYMMRRNSDGTLKEREETKKVGGERVIVDWNPSFQPEDFSEHGKDISHEPGPSSKRKHGEKKDKGEEEGTELDLNLSL
ncbi:hypothetical protein OIU76_016980 [Salix suchowensis]|nr:hypothetical protein OIU76_016980 [Salix suchowensis]